MAQYLDEEGCRNKSINQPHLAAQFQPGQPDTTTNTKLCVVFIGALISICIWLYQENQELNSKITELHDKLQECEKKEIVIPPIVPGVEQLKELEIMLSIQEIEFPKDKMSDFLEDIAEDITSDILQNYDDKTKNNGYLSQYKIDDSNRRVKQLRKNILNHLEAASKNGYSVERISDVKIQLKDRNSYSKIIYAKMKIVPTDNDDAVHLDIILSITTKTS